MAYSIILGAMYEVCMKILMEEASALRCQQQCYDKILLAPLHPSSEWSCQKFVFKTTDFARSYEERAKVLVSQCNFGLLHNSFVTICNCGWNVI